MIKKATTKEIKDYYDKDDIYDIAIDTTKQMTCIIYQHLDILRKNKKISFSDSNYYYL